MDRITAEKRDPAVKTKKARQAGFVPGSIFGRHLKESIAIQLDESTARRLVRTKREGSKLQLTVDGQVYSVQIKDKEQDTLNNQIVHLNFQLLQADQKVNSVIHLVLENVDKVAGTLEKMVLEIPYASLPADMIDTIPVDLDGMKPGTSLTAADIPQLQSDKIELQLPADTVLLRLNDKKRVAGFEAQ